MKAQRNPAPLGLLTWAVVLGLLSGGCGQASEERSDAGGTSDTADGGATSGDPPPAAWQAAQTPDQCQPLAAAWDCLYPWPSDWYRAQTSAGPRIDLPPTPAPLRPNPDDAALPGTPIDFINEYGADGFPVLPQIAIRLPAGVTASNLTAAYAGDQITADFAPSTQADHPTLLLEVSTGRAIAHFCDVDQRPEQVLDRALILRPVEPLRPGQTYAVALRAQGPKGGVLGADGKTPAPPSGFLSLRDGKPLPALQKYAGVWESQVFAPLQKAGVARQDLLLAWSFTTRTQSSAAGDMLRTRELVLGQLADLPLQATITQVFVQPAAHVALRLEGQLQVPLVMDAATPGARLARDGQGKVKLNGMASVGFSLVVPASVAKNAKDGSVRILQFGHGFFGSRAELYDGFVGEFLDQTGMVGMAVDWWGMSFPDAAFLVSDLITAPNQAPRFVERVHQGMANQLVLTWAAQQGLWQLPQTQVAAKVDMAQIYFYGLSQGHILGGTQVALNPRLSKAALGVGGAGFGLMMSRAAPFETFLAMLEGATGSRQGATRAALLLGTPLERIDPVTYAPWLLASAQGYGAPLPGNPPQRQILMHAGFADTQVPNLATHVHARALGLALLAPAARPVFGLSPKAAPLESALVEFNMGYKPLDMLGIGPDGGNPVHNGQRALPSSVKQIDQFMRPGGLVQQVCDGPCDPN
jgi:hypothetical protein